MKLALRAIVFVIFCLSQAAVSNELTFSDDERALLRTFSQWPSAVPADPGNEYSGIQWAEVLGEKLFSDPVFSANQSISCASCHQADRGFTDGSPVAMGGAKAHFRNTQGLLNVGYQRWFGWDGGADSLWSASLRPMFSKIEMASDMKALSLRLRDTQYIAETLNQNSIDMSSMDDESLVVLMSKFMGAYMRTLKSGKTSFDEFVGSLINEEEDRTSYPLAAQRGMKIFFGEGNCFVCHFGANFSNGEFHDIGRPFFTGVGQVDPGRFSGIERLKNDRYSLNGIFNGTRVDSEMLKSRTVKLSQINFGQWKTPSLRNLLLTAPYMHDGSLNSIRDVVDYYAEIDPTRLHSKGEAILRPFQWSDGEREDLVEFLSTLSSRQ